VKSQIFVTGPLFNESEREYAERLRSLLIPVFDVYLPQREGGLLPDIVESGISAQSAKAEIFLSNVQALSRCDVFLAILNGRTIEEGTAFELGIAWTLRKPCWGLKDDFRQRSKFSDNPMIEGALNGILSGLDQVPEWAASFNRSATEAKPR
jgi:nucleoside 2-deoxyribosyltransferase